MADVKEVLVPEGQVAELLGLGKPTSEKVARGVHLALLRIEPTTANPATLWGSWLRARDVERLLRVEAASLGVAALERMADLICERAGLRPARVK